MATITTDTFLDGGTARTAGEVWQLNSGAKLTIRTDTRVHANAPASMTGSLGAIGQSTNSQIYIDATNVRWLAFTSGAGTVPAIGTSITQGAVSGYLLGVWVDLTTAPTAVGAAMPASGFIKFREVTAGPYTAAPLSGISATASGPDVLGWIEVVMRQSNAISYSSLATRPFTTRGGWFSLGTTSGAAGQVIQMPTNGGGANTLAGGVQIETSPGSGEYEWWGSLYNSANTATVNPLTDIRSKVLRNIGSGQLIIGQNAVPATIYVPPAGCKIRCPNIFLRQCASGTDATNAAIGSSAAVRPNLSGSGEIGCNADIANVHSDWVLDARQGKKLIITDSFTDSINFGCSVSLEQDSVITNVCSSSLLAVGGPTFAGVNSSLTINGFMWVAPAVSFTINTSSNITINNFTTRNYMANGSSLLAINQSSNIAINNLITVGNGLSLTTTSNVTVNGYDYTSTTSGDTTSTKVGAALLTATNCSNVTFSNATFGFNGTLTGVNPYGQLVTVASNTGPIKIRNFGTAASPLNCGATNTNAPGAIVNLTSAAKGVEVKRVYLARLRSGSGLLANGSIINTDTIFENCGIGYSSSSGGVSTIATRTSIKGLIGTQSTNVSMYETPSIDGFSSNTVGYNVFSFGYKGNSNPGTFLVSAGSNTAFYDTSGAKLTLNGDYAIVEQLYFAKGHTALANSAPVLGGSITSMSTSYQIDTGAGWNGTWKSATGANLSAEIISPSTGFKLKIRVTATATATQTINSVTIATVSSTSAQTDNLYPLDVVNLNFTGLQTGSEVRCYTGTDPATAVELSGIEATSGSTFSLTHSSGGIDGYIMIFALGYQAIYLPYTYKTTNDTLLIQQTIDRNYNNPV